MSDLKKILKEEYDKKKLNINPKLLMEMILEALTYAPEIYDSDLLPLIKQIDNVQKYIDKHPPISLGKALTIYTPQPDRKQVSLELKDKLESKYKSEFPDLSFPLIVDRAGSHKGVKIKLGRGLLKTINVKPIRGSGIQNRGDVAEGLLGAALTVAFNKGGDDVTKADVESFLEALNAREKRQTRQERSMTYKTLTTENRRADDTVDTNTCVIKLSPRNFDDLMDIKKRSALDSLLDSVVAFANSEDVKEASKIVATNGVDNTISVISDGVSNQKATKVDIKTYLDGKRTPLGRISLKAATTDQLGQIGGSWEQMSDLFKLMFDIDLDNELETQWEAVMNKKPRDKEEVSSVAIRIYQDATEKINQQLRSKGVSNPDEDVDFIKRISNGLRYQVALEEEGVILVQLDNRSFKKMNFDELEDILRENKIDFVAEFSRAGRPTIFIKDRRTGEALFKVRFRFDKNQVRQYIEKQSLLTKLLTATRNNP